MEDDINFEDLMNGEVENEQLNSDEPKIIMENRVISPTQIEPIEVKKPETPRRSLKSDSKQKRRDPDLEPEQEIEPFDDQEEQEEEKPEPVKPKSVKKSSRKLHVNEDGEEVSEEELVKEYEYKFRMLKRNYPHVDVPEKYSSLKKYKKAYDRALKEVSNDVNVKNYHMYLIFGFFAIEYFAKNVIGIELSGFTINRINHIRRYNHLLIELGERSYSSIGSNWPVEVRLCLFILVDAVIFYIVGRVAGGNNQIMETVMNVISGIGSTSGGNSSGGLGDIMGLLSQVMGGVNLSQPLQPEPPKSQPQNQPQDNKPYEMRRPPKFVKKT
jgi:hypothetical protein